MNVNCLNAENKVDYIIRENSEVRKGLLLNQLKRNSNHASGSVTHEMIESFAVPKGLDDNVRFDYSFEELKAIAAEFGLVETQDQFKEFLIFALLFCGIRIGNDEALEYVKTISGFAPGFRFYRVSGLFGTSRITVRVVPNHWKGRFTSHFVLRSSTIWIDNYKLGELKAIFTDSSIFNLSYITENQEGEIVLSVNPFQKCAQHCRFCFKGTRAMLTSLNEKLVNLSAEEIVRYVEVEYPNYDFSKIIEIVVLTARFGSLNQLMLFMERFYKEIVRVSNGLFDPNKNDWQRIKVSTHLLTTREAMEQVYNFGVRRYIYPIEIFNDALRQTYMTSLYYQKGNNKGDASIDEVYTCLTEAKKVYGADNVEPVVILGIDTFEDTFRGLQNLKRNGINLLTYNVFRVYDSDQLEMYHMSLKDILWLQHFISENFKSSFRQKITNSLPNYNRKYRDIKEKKCSYE